MGLSSVTGQESILFADNASFDGTPRGGAMTSDGQLWIGSTSGRHVRLGTLTAGNGINIQNGSGNITISKSAGVSFFAYQAASITNATGDSTAYKLGNTALTKKFDTGTNLNTNGTFTAPVDGVYFFGANASVSNLSSGHVDFEVYITASATNYNGQGINPYVCQSGQYSAITQGMTCLVNMVAGDTAFANIIVGNSTKTVTVLGSSSPNTYFYGYLVS